MIKMIDWQSLSLTGRKKILQRSAFTSQPKLIKSVNTIIQDVKKNGDIALKKLTNAIDKVTLTNHKVSQKEINAAKNQLNKKEIEAILFAKKQIEKVHLAQYQTIQKIKTCDGVVCEKHFRPIEKVGLYIPGGLAPLVSTVLMLGVPAKIAQCSIKVICTPPNQTGKIHPAILFAAKYCGINQIYKVGGAQAISAMAYGTKTIPKVDKIFGPGNAWVTQAKAYVSQDPCGASIDMPAGPSELLIIADKSARCEFIAADLLSQAEHGVDSQVILLTNSNQQAINVKQSIEQQIKTLPRQKIIRASLKKSAIIVVNNLNEAFEISNNYAPEHLILNIKNARNYVNKVNHAGAVFLGSYAAETCGDYVTGSNHVLPTYGYAKTTSGLSLSDFMKTISVQEVTQKGLQKIGKFAQVLSNMEGLDAHKNAVTIRLKTFSGNSHG